MGRLGYEQGSVQSLRTSKQPSRRRCASCLNLADFGRALPSHPADIAGAVRPVEPSATAEGDLPSAVAYRPDLRVREEGVEADVCLAGGVVEVGKGEIPFVRHGIAMAAAKIGRIPV